MVDDLRQAVKSAAKRLAGVSVFVIGAMLIVSAWAWVRVPADKLVPVHWGPSFQVDGYASKTLGLFWLPGLAAAISVLMAAMLLLPKSETVARSTKAYVAVSTAMLLFLLGSHVVFMLLAAGRDVHMPSIAMIMLGGMLMVLGNYMSKIRRNRWLGVRTPWTRTSESCWDKTHRLASRLFVGLGLVFIAVALGGVRPEHMAMMLIVGILALTLSVYVYSYVVWRAERSHL